MAKKKSSSQDMSLTGARGNRTGLKAAWDGSAMLENASVAIEGSPADFVRFRANLSDEAGPIGTMPRPATLTAAAKQAVRAAVGEKLNVLLDKMAERLAFERTGTRLYEGLLLKYDLGSGFSGGPRREELLQFRDDEATHYRLLEHALEELDADPTSLTPSADLTAVASSGIMAVIADARTDLAECLEAILIAELADHDAWERLKDLAEGLGHSELAEQFERCRGQEERHLEAVRRWVSARTEELAGAS
jgi:rubrerythrin